MRLTVLTLALALVLSVPSMASAQASNRSLWWSGLALSSGGSVISLIGAYGMRKTECKFVLGAQAGTIHEACFNTPNYPVVFTGLGLATAGSVMMAIGARQSIAIGQRRVTYIRRW